MIINLMTTIVAARLSHEPVMVPEHARKPWQGLAVSGGFRVSDNSTRVSEQRHRHE